MPSTSRFRSKTSEITDLLRGSSKSADTHLTLPGPPPQDYVTPTKGKLKLGFLRKRKSGSVSPTPSPSSGQGAPSQDIPPGHDFSSRCVSLSRCQTQLVGWRSCWLSSRSSCFAGAYVWASKLHTVDASMVEFERNAWGFHKSQMNATVHVVV